MLLFWTFTLQLQNNKDTSKRKKKRMMEQNFCEFKYKKLFRQVEEKLPVRNLLVFVLNFSLSENIEYYCQCHYFRRWFIGLSKP